MLFYIDPGTGSMLFSILIGIVGTLVFFGQKVLITIRFIISGGKIKQLNSSKIPYVIFSDHKRYWNVFKPICDEFERRKTPVVFWTASPDDPALEESYSYVKTEFIGSGNKAYAKLNMMNAGTVLATTPNLQILQWKRSRNVERYVHIPHSVDDMMVYRMFGLDFYDAVLLSGEFQKKNIRALEERRKTKKKDLVVVGCPYLDVMAARYNAQKHALSDKKERISVLLAPSWGEKAIFATFGEEILKALVDTGFDITIRPHPQSFISEKNLIEPLQKKYPDSEHLHWNRDNDNFDVLASSDILITDFSAIMIEYSLVFDKPFIYADTSFNPATYDAAWFKEPVWQIRVLPQLGIPLAKKDFPNLRQIIEKTLASSEFKENRRRISDEARQNKGKAAVAAVDYLTKGGV